MQRAESPPWKYPYFFVQIFSIFAMTVRDIYIYTHTYIIFFSNSSQTFCCSLNFSQQQFLVNWSSPVGLLILPFLVRFPISDRNRISLLTLNFPFPLIPSLAPHVALHTLLMSLPLKQYSAAVQCNESCAPEQCGG